jgi:hypothetical protein
MKSIAQQKAYSGYLVNTPEFWLSEFKIHHKAKQLEAMLRYGMETEEIARLADACTFLYEAIERIPKFLVNKKVIQALVVETTDIYLDIETVLENDTEPEAEAIESVMNLAVMLYKMASNHYLPTVSLESMLKKEVV